MTFFYTNTTFGPCAGCVFIDYDKQESLTTYSLHRCLHICTCESTRAHVVQLLNEKIAALMPLKNKTVRARACCRIRNCRDFQKKGKRKPTCHFPSSVYSLPSLGVFTFRIVLNRILHKSSLLTPMESRRTRRPTFNAEERLERRREQDRRRHAESQLLFHYQKFFVE